MPIPHGTLTTIRYFCDKHSFEKKLVMEFLTGTQGTQGIP